MADEEARPDAVLVFVDSDGTEWLAAAYLGDLERYEDGHIAERKSIHSTLDGPPMALKGFKVVGRG